VWGVETPKLSNQVTNRFVAGWLSRMSKALPKGGSALARAQVSNIRLYRRSCPKHLRRTGMRFVGPITPGQIDGKPTSVKELAWMLERIHMFVERQLRADGFYNLEVSLIPTVKDKLVVTEFKNRAPHHAFEKVRMMIPEDLKVELQSPTGEEITLRFVSRESCEQGLYTASVGRID
jgi:hypothetical protein